MRCPTRAAQEASCTHRWVHACHADRTTTARAGSGQLSAVHQSRCSQHSVVGCALCCWWCVTVHEGGCFMVHHPQHCRCIDTCCCMSCFEGPRHALVASAAARRGGRLCGWCAGGAAAAQSPLVAAQEASGALSPGPAAWGPWQQEGRAAGGAGDTVAAAKPSAQLSTQVWQGRVTGPSAQMSAGKHQAARLVLRMCCSTTLKSMSSAHASRGSVG